MIVMNPKGELRHMHPDMQSDTFNPLALLDHESSEFYSQAKTIAEACVSLSGDSKSDFFEASFIDLLAAFCRLERIHNGDKAN
jgi:type IV secretory pathway TraG/TraD family ATPase VirD4